MVAQNTAGETALALALKCGQAEVALLLMQRTPAEALHVHDKERNTLVHAAARGGLPALAMDLVDMLGADAIGLQNAQGESALDVASGAGVGMALMRRVPAEVLRTMDMTRVPWLHQSLCKLVVPLLLKSVPLLLNQTCCIVQRKNTARPS